MEQGKLASWPIRLSHIPWRRRDAAVDPLYDQLTGLPNRALFEDRLEHALAAVGRSTEVVGVLLLDLRDHRSVEDALGSGAGDELLAAASIRLRAVVRASETLARWSGDELAMIVEANDTTAMVRAAERLLAVLQAPFPVGGSLRIVHMSVGVASTSQSSTPPADLVHQAHVAMHSAGRAGKNRFAIYRADVPASA